MPFREPFKIDGDFGEKRSYGYHSGTDLNGTGGGNTDCGYKLFPITKAEVIHNSEADVSYGKVVVTKIEGPWGTRWIRYCHCREILIRSGVVTPETPIATLGTTGNSSACHLHIDCIKKPLPNWRMYAKDEAALNEYFEDFIAFFNKWKDVEQEDMPEYFKKLLLEYNIDINNEGKIREIFGKAKDFDDKVRELTEQVKSANETLADKAREVSLLTDKVTNLENRLIEIEQNYNVARSERDKATWERDKLAALTKTQEEELERFRERNDIRAYSWLERFLSLFSRG